MEQDFNKYFPEFHEHEGECKPECEYENNEAAIVFNYNNGPLLPPIIVPNTEKVFNIKGKFIGYNWYYNDAIELDINIKHLLFNIGKLEPDLPDNYWENKTIELIFTDLYGTVDYTIVTPAESHIKVTLNTDETNTIKRNHYKLHLVLVGPEETTRTNLLNDPYEIYVK